MHFGPKSRKPPPKATTAIDAGSGKADDAGAEEEGVGGPCGGGQEPRPPATAVVTQQRSSLVPPVGVRRRRLLRLELHPVFMLIGFIILGGEAVISYKALPLTKQVKKLIHLVLHAIALVLGIIGIYTAFKFHNESGIVNLYSLHSWFGIGVIVLYGLQWLYGFLTFYYPGGSNALRSESLPWHVLFGTFVYILAVGTAALGFLEKLTFLESSGLYKYGPEAVLVNFTAIVTVLFGAFVILSVISKGPQADDGYSYSAI